MSARRLLHACFALLSGWWLAAPVAFGEPMLSDQQMKAAYVLNFVRYTEWPERAFATPESPLAICVFGESGALGLTGIAGKIIRGHAIQVRSVAAADEARYCHVLFVSEYDTRRFVGILRALQNAPILTISEADGFIDVGGMIGLVHLDNRLQFEVNLGVVQQAQLKASSQLLRLARNVIEARR
jgi:hypothetical protein